MGLESRLPWCTAVLGAAAPRQTEGGNPPEENATVKAFCETKFGVRFPLAGISHVRGAQASPFYAWVREQKGWEPNWNFCKVLIGRDGRVAGTYGSGDEPQGARLSAAIEAELAKG